MDLTLLVKFGMLVALRKESVDRNMIVGFNRIKDLESLSARRAWIEITIYRLILC